MKRIILLELCFLFLATTFQSDNMTGWVQQTIPRPDMVIVDLCFTDSLTGYFVNSKYSPSDSTFIFMTFDGGDNWTNPFKDNIYLTSIQFINSNIGYSAGRDFIPINGIIKKTTDGGNNWNTVSVINGSGRLDDVFFANKDTGWVCSLDIISGGLWRTINGGLSWQLQLDYNYTPSKIFFVNSNTGWVICNAGINLFKTTNCGLNWNIQSSTTSGFYYDVFFATKDIGWIVKSIVFGGHDALIRSTNGGNNWDTINAPVIPTESRLFFIGNKRGWAGSGPNKIYATKDGFNWGYQYSPRFAVYNTSFADSSHGWAGYGGLVHTSDGGGPITQIINKNEQVVNDYILFQNYPNPFNEKSIIKYNIPSGVKRQKSNVKILVYDITGKEITTMLNNNKSPGTYEMTFDAKNLTSGIYFYTLNINGERIDTKKAVLLK